MIPARIFEKILESKQMSNLEVALFLYENRETKLSIDRLWIKTRYAKNTVLRSLEWLIENKMVEHNPDRRDRSWRYRWIGGRE